MDYGQVLRKLRRVEDPTKRRMYFSALLGQAANITPDDLIVVGGSAIEFYTVGEYTSGDIDIVSRESDRLKDVVSPGVPSRRVVSGSTSSSASSWTS